MFGALGFRVEGLGFWGLGFSGFGVFGFSGFLVVGFSGLGFRVYKGGLPSTPKCSVCLAIVRTGDFQFRAQAWDVSKQQLTRALEFRVNLGSSKGGAFVGGAWGKLVEKNPGCLEIVAADTGAP